MAEAMSGGIAGLPMQQPAEMRPEDLAAFEQMRQDISPSEFNETVLSSAAEADPMAVAEFKAELRDLQLPREVLDVLNTMVDEILASPEKYQELRMKYMSQDIPEDLLPPQFDPEFFSALNLAVDEIMASSGPEMAMGPQNFANGGVATLRPITEAMRQQGRYGDTMLAHISPREAMVLKKMGGSGTINPYTGLPEFFLKKLFKGVGKALKKVGQAVKKFASSKVGKIVTTLALAFVLGPAAATALGVSSTVGVAAVSGFIGSAGSTLLGGGNLKDALKAGAIGGLIGGAGAGVFGGAEAFQAGSYTGPTTVGGQLTRAKEAVFGAPEQTLPDLGTAATETAAETTAQSFPATVDTAAGITRSPIPQATGIETVMPGDSFAATLTNMPSPVAAAPADGFRFYEAGRGVAGEASAAGQLGIETVTEEGSKSLVQRGLDKILPSRIEAANTMSPRDALAQISRETKQSVQALQAVPTNTVQGQMIADRLAQLTKGPGLLTKYGPLAAVGLGTLAATGGFKAEEPQVPPGFESMAMGISPGQQLLEQRPDLYGLRFGGVNTVSTTSPFQYYRPQQTQPVMGAAKGGEADRSKYPRKNGHISGPGTGTSDDIPAMLSDGEFVFTAKAVRNMGDGSRRKGAKRMYALMKKLEGRA